MGSNGLSIITHHFLGMMHTKHLIDRWTIILDLLHHKLILTVVRVRVLIL